MRIPLRFVAPAALATFVFAALLLSLNSTGTPVATAAGDCYADEVLDAEEKAFLTLINQYRAENGRAPLGISYTLSRAAAWKSKDMGVNHYFAHDDLDRTWVQRIRDCGYGYNTYLGENIAAGYQTAAQVFQGWKNSPGHNANMLSANYTTIGIGRAAVAGSPYGVYWSTEFGGYDDGWANTGGSTSTPMPTSTPRPAPTSTPGGPSDTTAPLVFLAYTKVSHLITFRTYTYDASGVTRMDFYVDGQLRVSDTQSPFTFNLALDGRAHDVRAQAYDLHGNTGSSTRTVR